eukprot:12569749-Ditylum_brightwellii.AAC.1
MHHFLNLAAKKDMEEVCSVCWSGGSEGAAKVHECIDCGLLVHLDCCLDRGEMTKESDEEFDVVHTDDAS